MGWGGCHSKNSILTSSAAGSCQHSWTGTAMAILCILNSTHHTNWLINKYMCVPFARPRPKHGLLLRYKQHSQQVAPYHFYMKHHYGWCDGCIENKSFLALQIVGGILLLFRLLYLVRLLGGSCVDHGACQLTMLGLLRVGLVNC